MPRASAIAVIIGVDTLSGSTPRFHDMNATATDTPTIGVVNINPDSIPNRIDVVTGKDCIPVNIKC